MMEMGIVPTGAARRTTTPVVAVLRCRAVPRASAQKTAMQPSSFTSRPDKTTPFRRQINHVHRSYLKTLKRY